MLLRQKKDDSVLVIFLAGRGDSTLYNVWMREGIDAGEMLEMGFVKKFDGCWMIFVRMMQGSIVGRIVGFKVVYIDVLSEGLI